MKNIFAFLSFIRWKNIALLIVMQIFFKIGLESSTSKISFLPPFLFSLLIIATICIAAAGNIINDYFDVETDKINKPKKTIITSYFSKKRIFQLYFFLNSIGLISGIILSFKIDKIAYSFFFIGIILALYFYSKTLKKTLFIGNLLIAFILAFSVLMIPIFEKIHFHPSNKIFMLFLEYTLLVFSLNIFREIIKDIEDINGDYKINANTLPIVLGRKRTQYISLFFGGISLYLATSLGFQTFEHILEISIFFTVAIIIPILFIMYKTAVAEKKIHYKKISLYTKLVLLLGIISTLFTFKFLF
ncbi:geranylgeranylglycerol-phosphate geranylgeranyltransferase [Aureivirga marina]|uniref:geranylgeranylglycerol-phosphate geranylgeranyltransferase n=1 Tax=Aureivirga marina TaxID=1182451 RepID=UPI0018C92E34|nr:geranylgeranylglycerol-phosphate geranylgeranyltransferase [Aureivirga marina]